ncbi:uncharacterized protein L3040_009431 [Drepanopeziza brunnea f. sp. 'multigermtubi']|uniref:uncharacterized protein n=1 Tax=Drepanopeziza brunnea f. sp. 'multigermtubi' TaxID=698441 RepID=UPI00239AE57B|nr:hypothetical protein L3040_009431 [Drepanopeziza brunnea f. sp. 'multigermtubi']
MAPASNEEQFKFLISCIRYSNNGKVDFGQVAKECKIVSKGAAAKRYERMMRSHGIAPNAATIKPAPRNLKSERQQSLPSSSSPSAAKKRKTEGYLDENTTADDDEGFGMVKPEPAVMIKEQFVVKEEETHRQQPGQLSLGDAANLMQYYDTPTRYSGGDSGGGDGSGSVSGHGNGHGLGMDDGYTGEYTASPSYGMSSSPYGLASHTHSHSQPPPQAYDFASRSPYGSPEMGAGMGGMHLGEPQKAPIAHAHSHAYASAGIACDPLAYSLAPPGSLLRAALGLSNSNRQDTCSVFSKVGIEEGHRGTLYLGIPNAEPPPTPTILRNTNNDFDHRDLDPDGTQGEWWKKVWQDEKDKQRALAQRGDAHQEDHSVDKYQQYRPTNEEQRKDFEAWSAEAEERDKKKGIVKRPEDAVVVARESKVNTGVTLQEFLTQDQTGLQGPSAAAGDGSRVEKKKRFTLERWLKKLR